MIADVRLVRVLMASSAIAFVMHQAYATFQLHLQRSGYSATVYGLLMSLNGLLVILLELSVTTVTRRIPALIALALGLVLNGIGFGAIGIAGSTAALALTVVIWTFGEMVYSPVGAAYIADIAPLDLRARYQAAYTFTFSMGLMLAPIGGTLLYSVSPSVLWTTCFGLSVAAAGLMAGSWLRERGTDGRDAASGSALFPDETATPAD
jgi:MFS family permease